MTTIYKAEMPEIFGYGIVVYADSSKEAERLLMKEFYKARRNDKFMQSLEWAKTFKRAMAYFCGGIDAIETPCVGYGHDYGIAVKRYD